MSGVVCKKGFCYVWHRRGGVSTSLAESPSRDFGSIIFTSWAADDHMSWRPIPNVNRKTNHVGIHKTPALQK